MAAAVWVLARSPLGREREGRAVAEGSWPSSPPLVPAVDVNSVPTAQADAMAVAPPPPPPVSRRGWRLGLPLAPRPPLSWSYQLMAAHKHALYTLCKAARPSFTVPAGRVPQEKRCSAVGDSIRPSASTPGAS